MILTALYFNLLAVVRACETENDNSFLWKVQKKENSDVSYLFGTIHVPYTQVWDTVAPSVLSAFARSDTVLFEMELQDGDAMMHLARCKRLKRKQTVESFLSPSLYQRVWKVISHHRRQKVEHLQLPPGIMEYGFDDIQVDMFDGWERLRPEWLLFTLYQMGEDTKASSTPTLDLYLAQKAGKMRKSIESIESIHEQCHPLVSFTQEEIIFAINYTISYLEEKQKGNLRVPSVRSIVQSYRCGTIGEEIFESHGFYRSNFAVDEHTKSKIKRLDEKMKEDIIRKRNIRMATRIADALENAQDSSTFVAVGAGHFFGDNSIVQQLVRLGFSVTAVPGARSRQKTRSMPQRFNSLWTRDVNQRIDVLIEAVPSFSVKPSVAFAFVLNMVIFFFKF